MVLAREKIVTQAVRVRLRVRRECLEWSRTLFSVCLVFSYQIYGIVEGVEIVRERKDSDSRGRDWSDWGFRERKVLLLVEKEESSKTKKNCDAEMFLCENDFRAKI
jgi:hypothetical protein